MRLDWLVIAVAVFSLTACAAPRTEEPMVLRFVGDLPCADCPGIRTDLTLKRKAPGWAEGTYVLSETYLERGGPRVTTGDWTTLRGDDRALKALDRGLRRWPKRLPDTLKRVP